MTDKQKPDAGDKTPQQGASDKGGASLIERASEMKQKASDVQAEIAGLEGEGQAADGLVKVTVDGTGRMRRIKIDPQLTEGPVAVLEEMILTATENARRKVKDETGQRLKGLAGDLPLPQGILDMIGALLPDRK